MFFICRIFWGICTLSKFVVRSRQLPEMYIKVVASEWKQGIEWNWWQHKKATSANVAYLYSWSSHGLLLECGRKQKTLINELCQTGSCNRSAHWRCVCWRRFVVQPNSTAARTQMIVWLHERMSNMVLDFDFNATIHKKQYGSCVMCVRW